LINKYYMMISSCIYVYIYICDLSTYDMFEYVGHVCIWFIQPIHIYIYYHICVLNRFGLTVAWGEHNKALLRWSTEAPAP
jgi:hypothetical protein